MFRRAPSPADPSGISKEEPRTAGRDVPEAETSVASKQKSGLMRAVQKINPLNLKVPPFPVSKTASSESVDEDSSQGTSHKRASWSHWTHDV